MRGRHVFFPPQSHVRYILPLPSHFDSLFDEYQISSVFHLQIISSRFYPQQTPKSRSLLLPAPRLCSTSWCHIRRTNGSGGQKSASVLSVRSNASWLHGWKRRGGVRILEVCLSRKVNGVKGVGSTSDVIQASGAGKFREEVEKNRRAGRIHEPIKLGKLAGYNDNSKIHIILF